MRVLIIGIGSIGRRHAEVIHSLGGHELILADPCEDFLAEAAAPVEPVATFADYRDALPLQPDAAIICAPNELHADMAVACAEAGCHLLIEKPIADSLESANRICEVVERTGRVATVGYVLRFWPGISRVKELLDSDTIGRPLAARVMLGAKETLGYARTAWRQAGDASVLLLDYSHEFDYLRLYMGEVTDATCVAAGLGPDGDRLVTAASTLLRFTSGALGAVHMDYLQHPARRELEIIGETGRIAFDIRNMRLRVIAEDGTETGETWQVERNQAFAAQFEAFAQAIRGDRAPEVSVRDAASTLAVSLAAVRSAATGCAETPGA